MASGIGDLLDMALSQGRALPKPSQQGNSPSPSTDQDDGEGNGDDEEDELVVARLSNAALLASSILATHGHAEVTHHHTIPLHMSTHKQYMHTPKYGADILMVFQHGIISFSISMNEW